MKIYNPGTEEMGNEGKQMVGIDGEGENFKEFVQELYDAGKDDERESQIFTKETFVLSEKDLAIVNREVQQMLNEELEAEYYREEDDGDYEDVTDEEEKEDDSYYHGEQSFYNDEEEDVSNYEKEAEVAPSESFDSDAEYDSTQYIYDPPNKYKDRYLLYLLKVSPILVALLAVYLYLGTYTGPGITTVFNSSAPSPYLNHKIFVLEEEISSLRKLRHLDERVDSIEAQVEVIRGYIETLQLNPDLAANGDKVAKRIEAIEESIQKLSNNVERRVVTTTTTTKVVTTPAVRLPRESSDKVEGRYYNVASRCSVVRRLTSMPWRARRRKSVIERVLFGFPDFFHRVLQQRGKPNAVKSLGGVNLLSAANHPRNALLDSPDKFWQIQATNLPVYYTVSVPNPTTLHEVGLYHSRHCPTVSTDNNVQLDARRRWIKTAPRDVEVLLRPIEEDAVTMRDALAKYYNQDLKFNERFAATKRNGELAGWVRAGTMRYDVEVNNAYQALPWSAEVRRELARFRVVEVMFVVHSNWGDEVVVVDTIRIFEHAVQDASVDSGDDMMYLGEESL